VGDTLKFHDAPGQNARAGTHRSAGKNEGRIVPSVKYFTQNSMTGAYKRLGGGRCCRSTVIA
jgi:hypothetical protein